MSDKEYAGFDTFKDKLKSYLGKQVQMVIDTPSDICEVSGVMDDVGGDYISLICPGDDRVKLYNVRYIISCFVAE